MNPTTQIYDMNDDVSNFPFNNLHIAKPYNRNGTFFIRIELGNTPLYIQPPKCVLKQGFTKSGKKMFCDLIFTNENEQFLEWLEKLEQTCYLSIYNNRGKWFEPVLEKHEIEEYMTSPYKIIKSGKLFIIRTDIATSLGKCDLKVYDEGENEINHEDLKENTKVMTILEIKGIKCSVRSFQFEFELKQMLVIQPVKLFEKCIINPQGKIETSTKSSFLGEFSHVINDGNDGGGSGNDGGYGKNVVNGNNENGSVPDVNLGNVGFGKLEKKKEKEGIFSKKEENVVDGGENEDGHENGGQHGDLGKGDGKVVVEDQDKKDLGDTRGGGGRGAEEGGLGEHVGTMVEEVDFDLAMLENVETMHLKNKNDIYYEKYKEAKQKAKQARLMALAHYMEARRIKTTYLEDMNLEDSDADEDEDEDKDEDEKKKDGQDVQKK
jgi:hypothetical protein